jgi:hypothetical protein
MACWDAFVSPGRIFSTGVKVGRMPWMPTDAAIPTQCARWRGGSARTSSTAANVGGRPSRPADDACFNGVKALLGRAKDGPFRGGCLVWARVEQNKYECASWQVDWLDECCRSVGVRNVGRKSGERASSVGEKIHAGGRMGGRAGGRAGQKD